VKNVVEKKSQIRRNLGEIGVGRGAGMMRAIAGGFPKASITAITIARIWSRKMRIMMFMTAKNKTTETKTTALFELTVITSTEDVIVVPDRLASASVGGNGGGMTELGEFGTFRKKKIG
jgi:hypothetical protein